MSCVNCGNCIFTDDGYEMAFKCNARSKKGKSITWHMHTGTIQNGKFIPDDVTLIKKEMAERITRNKEPFWCPKRKEKNHG